MQNNHGMERPKEPPPPRPSPPTQTNDVIAVADAASGSTAETIQRKTISEGMFAEAGKSCLTHASIWSVVYLMGYYNVGLFWLLTPLLLSAVFEDDIIQWLRSNKKAAIKDDGSSQVSSSPTTQILARAKDVPPWVFFPDFERAEWINKILDNIWPNVEELVINAIVNKVEPVLDESENSFVQSIEVSRVSLGDIPPRIGGVKVYPVRRIVSRDEIVMEVDVDWPSNCDLQVSLKHTQQLVSASLKNILFQGHLRITLAPLLNDAPLVGGVKLSFLDEPKISFDPDGIAKIVDLPGVSSLVKKVIANQISQICVLPKSIFLPLVNPMPESVSRCQMPAGMLRVQVIQGVDLMAKDSSLLGGKSSDPYVIFSINDQCPKVKPGRSNECETKGVAARSTTIQATSESGATDVADAHQRCLQQPSKRRGMQQIIP